MKKIGIVLLILISLIGTLLGCGKQDVNKDLESIEASEIKQIEHTGTTGGKDGNYSYSFSDNQILSFSLFASDIIAHKNAYCRFFCGNLRPQIIRIPLMIYHCEQFVDFLLGKSFIRLCHHNFAPCGYIVFIVPIHDIEV